VPPKNGTYRVLVTEPGFQQGPPPTPGTGTIFINSTVDGTWSASWQSGPSCLERVGTREAAIAWAQRQPAERILIFDETADDYVTLP